MYKGKYIEPRYVSDFYLNNHIKQTKEINQNKNCLEGIYDSKFVDPVQVLEDRKLSAPQEMVQKV